MDIYSKKDRWKIYLAIGGIVIVLISMLYTNYLARRLGEEERSKVEAWVLAQRQINENPGLEDVTLHLKVLATNKTIPVILVNDRGGIDDAANFGADRNRDEDFLKKEVQRLEESGFEPLQGSGYKIYYQESTLLRQLRYFPAVQFVLIGAFVFLGYLGFSSSRKAEQNRVWAGMAKETAHQLGTPISAIVGWVDHLEALREEDPEVQEVVKELGKDVERLELIAERFSKIGSKPELKRVNLFEELEKSRTYMQRRASRKIRFDFPDPETALTVQINPPLFNWVIENLLRNALDALNGQGMIRVEAYPTEKEVQIEVTDTGKGIPAGKFAAVFKPGFTTKKRGWGLGLSLAKRIIEQYHHGKIFVKWSEEGKGTTFAIRLPANASTEADSHPKPSLTEV